MFPALFLDRDGTINEEVDFLSSPTEIKLIPRSADAIRIANQLGIKVFIVTNQSGIARGFLTEKKLEEIHNALIQLLSTHNAYIDAIYYCPHHPENGEPPYRTECSCRKPLIGMLERAVKEFNIDLRKSFVIGDKFIDILTGINAGANPILVLTGYGSREVKILDENNIKIPYIASDLYDAVQFVKNSLNKNRSI